MFHRHLAKASHYVLIDIRTVFYLVYTHTQYNDESMRETFINASTPLKLCATFCIYNHPI